MFQHIISTESTCESKFIFDLHVKQKNSPILKQSVSIKMFIQPYHSLISNSTAWCSTPTLLLICSQFVGKMIIHCCIADLLITIRTAQSKCPHSAPHRIPLAKKRPAPATSETHPSQQGQNDIFFGGTLWQKKLRGMLPFFETNDSINDVQSGLSRWHNFQTNGLVNS